LTKHFFVLTIHHASHFQFFCRSFPIQSFNMNIPKKRIITNSIAVVTFVLLCYLSYHTLGNVMDMEEGCYGLAKNYPDVVKCRSSTLSGLEFCSMMNGQVTDEGFNNAPVSITSGGISVTVTYAQAIDIFLKQVFSELTEYVTDIQKKRQGQVCTSCLDKLKALACGNSFPVSGMLSCIVNNAMGGLASIDKRCGTSMCGCPEHGLCSMDDKGQFCTLKTPPKDVKSILCLFTKLPNVPADVGKCNKYFTSIDLCVDAMSSCGCVDSSDVKGMCSKLFSSEGARKVDLPEGSCDSTANWCNSPQNGSSRRIFANSSTTASSGTTKDQLVCPNPDLCISNPAPITTPSIEGLSNLAKISKGSVTSSTLNQYINAMACNGPDDPNCAKGCTNRQALIYDPQARIDDNSCKRDPLVLMTWAKKNLPWMIAVLVIVVVILVALVIAFCITCFCCCCRPFCCIGKKVEL